MRAAYDHARRNIGVREVPGAGRHNPKIVDWLRGVLSWVTDDETPWCAAFANAMLAEAGIRGTDRANARSFERWGEAVADPREGDIVVFWRTDPSSWKGHVGFFVRFEVRGDRSGVVVVGGNQSNAVSEAWYPISRLLAFRRASPPR